MRQLFNLGETIIDTKTPRAATVMSIIPCGENSITDVYVLETDDELYLSDDSHLIVYNKYYWDELEVPTNE